MNLFNYQGLQIYYNNILKRVSFNKDDEFISFTISTLKIFFILAKNNSDINSIQVNQNASDIKILKLYGNFMLTMTSCKYHSTIGISKIIIDKLVENEQSIDTRISEIMFGTSSNSRDKHDNNSNTDKIDRYRQSIENVVKGVSNSSINHHDNNINKNKSLVDFIDHFMCRETGNSCGMRCPIQNIIESDTIDTIEKINFIEKYDECENSMGGGNCITKIVVEKDLHDGYTTSQINKESVFRGKGIKRKKTLMKGDKIVKRKRMESNKKKGNYYIKLH